jgi:hypothetical protein
LGLRRRRWGELTEPLCYAIGQRESGNGSGKDEGGEPKEGDEVLHGAGFRCYLCGENLNRFTVCFSREAMTLELKAAREEVVEGEESTEQRALWHSMNWILIAYSVKFTTRPTIK